MRRGMRLTWAMSIAAGAMLAALGAPSSSLAASKALKLETGGVGLVGGAPIVLSSTEVTIQNSFWSLACSETALTGTLAQNFKGKGNGVVITKETFGGGGSEGLCASTPEFVTTSQPLQTPELTLNTKGKALLKFTRLRLVPKANIEKPENKQEACVISAATFRGSFPVTTTAQPLVVTFTGAKMKIEAQGTECGAGPTSKPLFTGTFTATSRGSTVEAVIFSPH